MKNARRQPRFEAKSEGETGKIYVYDVIGDWFGITSQQVAGALERFKANGISKLEVYVNSPGGVAYDGVAIFNLIRRFEGEKTVFVDGLAASAASVVMLAGDKIVMGPGSMVMVHRPWNLAIGYADELRKEADTLDKLAESMVGLYVARTGKSADEVRALLDAETWFTADEAVAQGFAHEVATAAPDATVEEPEASNAFAEMLARFKCAPSNAIDLLKRARASVVSESPPAPAPQSDVDAALELADAETARAKELEAVVARLQADNAALAAKDEAAEKAIALAAAAEAKAQETEARAGALFARVTELEAEKAKAEIDAVLDAGAREGKVTPALRAVLAAEKDVARIKALVASMPRVAPPVIKPAPEGDHRAEQWEAFKPEELAKMQKAEPERFKALLDEYRHRTGRK